MRADLPAQRLAVRLRRAERRQLLPVRVDVEDDLVVARPAGGVVAAGVAAVAVRFQAAGERRALLDGLRHREVARHGTQARAGDLHRIEARLGVAARQLDAVGLDGHELQAVGLLRPEGVKVLRLGVGDELVDLHARAAVEEDAAVAALELVLRALALGRRRVARVLLAVDLSLAVDELGAHAHKAGAVEGGLDDDRLREVGGHPLAALLPVVAEAFPLDEPLPLGQLLHAVQLERERHRLARRVVDRPLVRGAAQEAVVQFAREDGGNRQREHRTDSDLHFVPFY